MVGVDGWTSHIDYVGFSVPIPNGTKDDVAWIHRNMHSELAGLVGLPLATHLLEGGDWAEGPRRTPYRRGYTRSGDGLYVWYGGQSNVLVEATGVGCAWLHQTGRLKDVLALTGKRLTRLDVAVDIQTEVTPHEFVAAGYSDRISSTSHADTASGRTWYVGARKSDRYAAVYRYAAPHPRSGLLRVEFRTRRKPARAAADTILRDGLSQTVAKLGASMNWQHELWTLDKAEKLHVPREDRTNAKTERWLIRQAAPAFRRLVASGDIADPVRWLEQWFLADGPTADNNDTDL